jgi:predicted Fe-S protein YdhL (DUF1289 family)
MNALESPCIHVCRMDPARNLCAGCGRTLDEIARWGTMTNAERAHVMNALPERSRAQSNRSQNENSQPVV